VKEKVMQQVASILWRVLKVVPVIGYVFVLAGAPAVLRRKGYFLGVLAIVLDVLPVICLLKAGVEIFTGDLIPDRFETPTVTSLESAA
jgi:uncharacterized membrane protein YiaA